MALYKNGNQLAYTQDVALDATHTRTTFWYLKMQNCGDE